MQSGGYRCSTEELDELVDIARKAPGVAGACLTGAGLGGCILVLVRKENVEIIMASKTYEQHSKMFEREGEMFEYLDSVRAYNFYKVHINEE